MKLFYVAHQTDDDESFDQHVFAVDAHHALKLWLENGLGSHFEEVTYKPDPHGNVRIHEVPVTALTPSVVDWRPLQAVKFQLMVA